MSRGFRFILKDNSNLYDLQESVEDLLTLWFIWCTEQAQCTTFRCKIINKYRLCWDAECSFGALIGTFKNHLSQHNYKDDVYVATDDIKSSYWFVDKDILTHMGGGAQMGFYFGVLHTNTTALRKTVSWTHYSKRMWDIFGWIHQSKVFTVSYCCLSDESQIDPELQRRETGLPPLLLLRKKPNQHVAYFNEAIFFARISLIN